MLGGISQLRAIILQRHVKKARLSRSWNILDMVFFFFLRWTTLRSQGYRNLPVLCRLTLEVEFCLVFLHGRNPNWQGDNLIGMSSVSGKSWLSVPASIVILSNPWLPGFPDTDSLKSRWFALKVIIPLSCSPWLLLYRKGVSWAIPFMGII